MTAPFGAGSHTVVQAVPVATDDLLTTLMIVPRDATVTSVKYTALATVTGAATNNRTLLLVNKGAAGASNVTVAGIDLVGGINATAHIPRTIDLSAAAALIVKAGDVLQWKSLHNGTGFTDPGGLVTVSMVSNYA